MKGEGTISRRLFLISLLVAIVMVRDEVSAQEQATSVQRAGLSGISGAIQQLLSRLPEKTRQRIRIGVSLRDLETGTEIATVRSDELFIPASIQKLVTSVVALKVLGSEYQFPTEFFGDKHPDQSGNIGALYVRGYGDPSMVNEMLWSAAYELKSRGIKSVERVIVDNTLFETSRDAAGSDPYNAALNATSLNYNSYAITVTPGTVGKPATVMTSPAGQYIRVRSTVLTVSGEANQLQIAQNPPSGSPLKPPALQLEAGSIRITPADTIDITVSGKIGVEHDTVTSYQTVPHPASYFGGTLKALLESLGVAVRGGTFIGETPRNAVGLFTYRSKELAEILRALNQYSNNFIAGQLVYAMGQREDGTFSAAVGLSRIGDFLSQSGIPRSQYQILDGSGLDRGNVISPYALSLVLLAAYRDFSIAPDLIASLSRFGHNGTLKKRFLLSSKRPSGAPGMDRQLRADSIWAKTGTLDGVSSLAGYTVSRDDRHLAFVIIINGPISKPDASEIEDGILRIVGDLGA